MDCQSFPADHQAHGGRGYQESCASIASFSARLRKVKQEGKTTVLSDSPIPEMEPRSLAGDLGLKGKGRPSLCPLLSRCRRDSFLVFQGWRVVFLAHGLAAHFDAVGVVAPDGRGWWDRQSARASARLSKRIEVLFVGTSLRTTRTAAQMPREARAWSA